MNWRELELSYLQAKISGLNLVMFPNLCVIEKVNRGEVSQICFDLFRPSRSEKIKSEIWDVCNNSLACIISLMNVYNHLHSEVSQICFEGGVAKTQYIPYKLILIGGVANQNNFATPPKYLRPLLTMQLKSRVKTNLRHFPTIYLLFYIA